MNRLDSIDKPRHVYEKSFRSLDDEVVMITTVGGNKAMLIKVDDDGAPCEVNLPETAKVVKRKLVR